MMDLRLVPQRTSRKMDESEKKQRMAIKLPSPRTDRFPHRK